MNIKRTFSVLLATACMISQLGMCVLAEDTVDGEEEDTRTYEELLEDAKTKSIEVMTRKELDAIKKYTYEMPVQTNEIEGWPKGPDTYAEASIVMDMDTGAVLYGKNIDKQEYPASITKLLTTLVALDNSTMDDKVKFTESSVDFLEYGDASVGMQAGEEITMKDALHAVLLASANEVSHAVAESVGAKMGGDYDTFIQAMNDYSEKLGCTGSHWMNANGLHDAEHYTTAHDMACIASAVSKEQEFLDIEKDLDYTIPPTNKIKEKRVFQQNHRVLWPENDFYNEYCIGGKTGFTDQASTTLVTMFDKDGFRLVCVTLKDYGVTAYEDTTSMIDYAFNNFTKCSLKDQSLPEGVASLVDAEAAVDLPNGVEFDQLECELSDPEKAENGVGTATYTYSGQNVGTVEVNFNSEYLQKEIDIPIDPGVKVKTESKRTVSGLDKTQLFLIIIAAGVVLVVVLAVLSAVMQKKRRRKAAQRRKMRSNTQRKSGKTHKRT